MIAGAPETSGGRGIEPKPGGLRGTPALGTIQCCGPRWHSVVAHRLGKAGVAGSNPARGSILIDESLELFFLLADDEFLRVQ
jgi:hypothetical protein